jgi:hypothetical protein
MRSSSYFHQTSLKYLQVLLQVQIYMRSFSVSILDDTKFLADY